MNTKNISIGVLAAVVIVLGVLVVKQPAVVTVPTDLKVDFSALGNLKIPAPVVNVPAPVVNVAAPKVDVKVPEQTQLGALSGPDIYFPVTMFNGLSYSSTFATSSTGAGTLTASNIRDKSVILSTNAGALTLTLPASSTMTSFLPKAGDRADMMIVNQGTALLTLAGGTGTLLQTASSTKTVNIGGSAILKIVRKTNTDFVVLMSPAI